jgi:hypothetical protein
MVADRRLAVLVALAVGVFLAWLAVCAMGALAAIPTPHALRLGASDHPFLALLVSMTLLVHVPVAILAFVVGWFLFRALRQASLLLVLVCAAPWLIYDLWSLVGHFTTQLPTINEFKVVFAWYVWPGVLAVPVGLWLASIATAKTAR